MGRKKVNKVYRYFDLSAETKTTRCLIQGCEKVLRTLHGSNLLRHLQNYHKKEYEEIMILNKESPSPVKIPKRNIGERVLQECTNLIAVHGRPLTLIDDQAFQNIISLIPNINITINSQNTRSALKSTAENLRLKLSQEMRNQIICLKVDIASLSNRSFMGVNAQYVKDGKIILRNLAVTELFKRHTSEHLKEVLILILSRFRIDIKQIYCITTDNGANILKMSRLLADEALNRNDIPHSSNSEINTSIYREAIPSTSNNYHNDIFHETNYILESEQSDSDTDIENVDDTSENYFYEQIQSVLRSNLWPLHHDFNDAAIVVRCAAHTLQLALQDACKDGFTQSIISSARNFIKRLRTPTFTLFIKEIKMRKPQLDCPTRWHSTVDMIESILNLKDVCATNELLNLPDETWNNFELFFKSMLPGKKLTKILEREQLTIGDFYLEWMKCKFVLHKINTPLTNKIIIHMKRREIDLFDNNAFINAIYLDPRVNSVLNSEQQRIAENNLISLYIRSKKIRIENKENEEIFANVQIINLPSTSKHPQSQSPTSELEDFLNNSYIEKHLHNISSLLRVSDTTSELTNRLKASFNIFLEEPLLRSTENVLQFWEKNQDKYPHLYKLACIALGAPATQVSVERLFSTLKFIISHLRIKLKDDIVEDILFVRSYMMTDVI